jgi:hypothetical protein
MRNKKIFEFILYLLNKIIKRKFNKIIILIKDYHIFY